ncbi:EAL domain-containing protein [Sinobaca sp. H24]|uniref:EAL domain-containing protein n=1 Tax=Sinobaca sp. H24 TaxID=2923376 RepID=UPI00207A63D3|nr:EAL domain-containing protein [Sinobaca sp. H24]
MTKSCDICVIKQKGYTAIFEEGQNIEALSSYFLDYPEEEWAILNRRAFWTREHILFDLLDYLEAHYPAESVYFVHKNEAELPDDQEQKMNISELRSEQQTAWIDKVIEKKAIRTHFQPIVEIKNKKASVIGHELLSRGVNTQGEIIPPFQLFEAARSRNRLFALDRACRMEAVKNAAAVKMNQLIFINFIPTAIYVPEHCLATTFELIKQIGVRPEQVVFEVVESDEVKDINHLKNILNFYRKHGFKYALDDVGTGANDLKKLASLEPHFVKLAREFADGVSSDPAKQNVALSVIHIAHHLKATPLAEGVERIEDIEYLANMGYELFQGYYFARPNEIPVVQLDGAYHVEA